mgnify:CR=1 FL=1
MLPNNCLLRKKYAFKGFNFFQNKRALPLKCLRQTLMTWGLHHTIMAFIYLLTYLFTYLLTYLLTWHLFTIAYRLIALWIRVLTNCAEHFPWL